MKQVKVKLEVTFLKQFGNGSKNDRESEDIKDKEAQKKARNVVMKVEKIK